MIDKGTLYSKDNSLTLNIFEDNKEELVEIGMNLIPIKFINLKEFNRFDLINNKELNKNV